MFVLTTIADTVGIPPPMFVQPTLTSVHQEIEKKYPNRVIMDVGLVVCRYGDALEIGDGVCVAGDGAAHHEVVFRLIVFRPFVDEVCIGTILESSEEGVRVTLGFFDDIFVPAYWMLRPSQFDADSGLWVWTPDYGDDDDDGDDNGGDDNDEEEPNRFEMEIGAEIRFKIKAINFTQVTNTAKGMQATTTTTSSSKSRTPHNPPTPTTMPTTTTTTTTPSSVGGSNTNGTTTPAIVDDGTANNANSQTPVRKRSSSVDLSDSAKIPASMHITASICEDGLGLVSWWSNQEEEEEEEDEDDGGGDDGGYAEEEDGEQGYAQDEY